MTSKQIVDKHFEKNYNYYRQVCYQYYRGRYLFEDLLNETYIHFVQVKPEVIQKFSDLNKLHCIGLKIIRSLYQKRLMPIKNKSPKGRESSPLFETPSLGYDIDFVEDPNGVDELEIQMLYNRAIEVIQESLTCPVKHCKEKTPYQLVQTFTEVQRKNINRISIETKVNRKFIHDTYKEAQEYLQKEITK